MTRPCPYCAGTGRQHHWNTPVYRCEDCDGLGVIDTDRDCDDEDGEQIVIPDGEQEGQ